MIRTSYKDSLAYQRSNRPELDKSGRPTGRMVYPLPFANRKDKAA